MNDKGTCKFAIKLRLVPAWRCLSADASDTRQEESYFIWIDGEDY
jgi:hypothetical protein